MVVHCTRVLTTVLLLVSLGRGAIISQSSIKDCSWGDPSEPKSPSGTVCSKKMLLSMVLGSGQGNTESLHANVEKAHEEGKTEMSVLKKPFRIELRKTAVVASYRAYLAGTANALPTETTISKEDCVDNFFASPKRLPCGIQFHGKTKKRVWDSQGFCCGCDNGFESQHNRRGGHSCDLGNLIQLRSSAHCMRMDDLWYDVFTLEMPMMQYKITLDVLELQGIVVNNSTGSRHVDWKLVSTFHLSPSRTIGRSKTGRVIAELEGSLLGSQAIKDLSNKMLLIPSVRMWPKGKPHPPAYTNGPNDWMLVDTSMVRLIGTECNKVGVGYTGFRRQPGRCNTLAGFCFHNQPLQLWNFDNEKRKKKESGRYMIHNFGKVHHDSHPNNDSFILKFFHEDLHNSFVTLRIDASDISFVRSVSSGRIVETYTVPFTAAVGHGSLTVEIGNTGEVLSEFSVSVVKCTSGLHDIAAKTLSLDPGEVKNTSFTLRSGDIDGGDKECEVQLYDSNFKLLDIAKINIKVGAACLCFGICGCVCEDEDDAKSPAHCPEAGPPTIYKPGPIGLTLFFMFLESIGAHGFIGFFASILLLLGFIKLSCGGIICCRKTKQQEYTKKMIDKGIPPKSPLLVQCSGECRGAKAARARYERKVKRLRAAGKSPHRLDDWRNTSFECQCKTELADIRMIHVVRTVCFFYFCCILPFIWLGRCLVWRIFKDTEANMVRAEQQVLTRAKKKGKLEKYGVVDIAAELKNFEEESEKAEKEKKAKEEQSAIVEALAMNLPTDGEAKKDMITNQQQTLKADVVKEKVKTSQPKKNELQQQDLGEKKRVKDQRKGVESRPEEGTERRVQEKIASPKPKQRVQKTLVERVSPQKKANERITPNRPNTQQEPENIQGRGRERETGRKEHPRKRENSEVRGKAKSKRPRGSSKSEHQCDSEKEAEEIDSVHSKHSDPEAASSSHSQTHSSSTSSRTSTKSHTSQSNSGSESERQSGSSTSQSSNHSSQSVQERGSSASYSSQDSGDTSSSGTSNRQTTASSQSGGSASTVQQSHSGSSGDQSGSGDGEDSHSNSESRSESEPGSSRGSDPSTERESGSSSQSRTNSSQSNASYSQQSQS